MLEVFDRDFVCIMATVRTVVVRQQQQPQSAQKYVGYGNTNNNYQNYEQQRRLRQQEIENKIRTGVKIAAALCCILIVIIIFGSSSLSAINATGEEAAFYIGGVFFALIVTGISIFFWYLGYKDKKDDDIMKETWVHQENARKQNKETKNAYAHVAQTSEYDPDELPKGWRKAYTKQNRMYYQNDEQGLAQWKHPLLNEEEMKDDENGLPNGWRMAYTKDNERYYQNDEMQIASWEKPQFDSPGGVGYVENDEEEKVDAGGDVKEEEEEEVEMVEIPPMEIGGMEMEDEEVLPDGWRMAYTEDGRKYYQNDVTKTTSWDMPKVEDVVVESGPGAGEGGDDDNGLGNGWRVAYTSDNRKYYQNDVTKETSWVRPN